MKVILLQDVKSLGKKGEVKEVKDGYGNNFLIKRKLAKAATKENMRILNANEQKKIQQEKELLITLNNQKKQIEQKAFQLPHKLGKNGSLYGAITKNEIADFLATQNINIDKKSIEIKSPIKTSGMHEIDIKLGLGIHAILKLEIIGQS